MIKNVNEAIDATAKWIEERANVSGARALVLGVSGGVDSAVVAGICSKTAFPVVGVIMPCHSSPSAIERAEEVITTFGLKRHLVHLEKAFGDIAGQVLPTDGMGVPTSSLDNAAGGALRSCLRAPTLDFVSKVYGGIIVGTGNRDEDEVTRYFQKRGDGCVDISPIAKYHKSEIYQLAVALGVPTSVIKATPSADLWGPDSGQEDEKELGLTYAEVEWGIQFAQKYSTIPLFVSGGVSSAHFYDAMTLSSRLGVSLTNRQHDVLVKLGSMEEKSRHKANPNLPVFDARAILNLDKEVVLA